LLVVPFYTAHRLRSVGLWCSGILAKWVHFIDGFRSIEAVQMGIAWIFNASYFFGGIVAVLCI
jgi:hypothetical protein